MMGKSESLDIHNINGNSSTTDTKYHNRGGCYVSTATGFVLTLLAACVAVGIGILVHFSGSGKTINCQCTYPGTTDALKGGTITTRPIIEQCMELIKSGNTDLCTTTTTTPNPTKPVISFGIHVTNYLTTDNYNESWVTTSTEGQTLYDGMINLQNTDETFSFQSTTHSTFGEFITSINNMTASTDDQQYWQILDKDGIPLQKGVSQTIPLTDDSFQFNLTTW